MKSIRSWLAGSNAFVPGRVHEGPIGLGSVFTGADGLLSGVWTIRLRVDHIEAYGHSLDELSQGMTGRLQLTGEGIEILARLNCPFLCVGAQEMGGY